MTYCMSPLEFSALIVKPALEAIGLWSQEAEQLVLGTAIHESGLVYLKQINGPALGYWQMEPATHDDVWNRMPRDIRRGFAIFGSADGSAEDLYLRNDYAAAMCRMKYRLSPGPIPMTLTAQAAYWKLYYNTPLGAGTVSEYIADWERAGLPNF